MSMFNTDAAVSSISVLAALELLLAMKMSAINGEQMAVARRAKDPRSAAAEHCRNPPPPPRVVQLMSDRGARARHLTVTPGIKKSGRGGLRTVS